MALRGRVLGIDGAGRGPWGEPAGGGTPGDGAGRGRGAPGKRGTRKLGAPWGGAGARPSGNTGRERFGERSRGVRGRGRRTSEEARRGAARCLRLMARRRGPGRGGVAHGGRGVGARGQRAQLSAPSPRGSAHSPKRFRPHRSTRFVAAPADEARPRALTHSGHQTGHSPHPCLAWSTCHSNPLSPHPTRAAAPRTTAALAGPSRNTLHATGGPALPPRPLPPPPQSGKVADPWLVMSTHTPATPCRAAAATGPSGAAMPHRDRRPGPMTATARTPYPPTTRAARTGGVRPPREPASTCLARRQPSCLLPSGSVQGSSSARPGRRAAIVQAVGEPALRRLIGRRTCPGADLTST